MNFWEPWKKIRSLAFSSAKSSQLEARPAAPRQNWAGADDWDYDLLDEATEGRAAFDRLVRLVLRALQSAKAQSSVSGTAHRAENSWFYERGNLPDKRRYFYIQAWDDEGWLFEEAVAGWVISRAVKIVHEQRFLRRRTSWEAANLLKAKNSPRLLRVTSSRYGDDPICLPIYEELFIADFRRQFQKQQDTE